MQNADGERRDRLGEKYIGAELKEEKRGEEDQQVIRGEKKRKKRSGYQFRTNDKFVRGRGRQRLLGGMN